MTETTRRIAVIGAGMAGLACAARLGRAGQKVQLFDKGRGPGGRMSTRRIDTPLGQVSFDHGAQYFTARGTSFRARIAQWAAEGIVAPWSAAGADAWVGTPGMNAPVRALAAELPVTWGYPVEALSPDGPGWRLEGPHGRSDRLDVVILALPAEQTAPLLAAHDADMAGKAAASRTEPCWTVMAAFDQRLPIAADCLRDQGPLGWAARNTSKPGRADPEAWVLQATPDWSRRHLEDGADSVCDALFESLQQVAGGALPRPVAIQAHRWRFARSAVGTDRALWSPRTGLGCCGD